MITVKLTPTTLLFVVALLGALISSAPASAKEFYKWQDDQGVTHYAAHPPKDRNSVKVRATNTQGTPPAEASEEENTEQQANATATAARAKNPERCAQARKNLNALNNKPRVRIKEGDSYRYLTAEEVTEHRRTAQKIIRDEC
jgi:hypothetical protein